MTTPVQNLMEPFALSFTNPDGTAGTQNLIVSQGRYQPGSNARAIMPTAMITLTGTQSGMSGGSIRIFRSNTELRFTHNLGTGTQIPMLQFSTKPGDYITIQATNLPAGAKAEVLLTIIPMPFSA